MKKFIIAIALATGFATPALADGFTCVSVDEELAIKVFNSTQPSVGTRTGAVMIVSDLSVNEGRRTIARFRAPQTLASEGATYTARVDLRFNDSGRRGENILGTKLGHTKTIELDVDHNYLQPIAHGTEVDGVVTLTKRNGDVISADMICKRYLRNR